MWVRISLLFGLVCVNARSQGELAISGVVVHAQSGNPIPNARVNLLPGEHAVITGSGGEFSFTGLPPGSYDLTASKPGFTPVGDRPLGLSVSTAGLLLKMARYGVIAGHVTDEFGDPVTGATVEVLTARIEGGYLVPSNIRSVYTDDRGFYRAWALPDGKYFVRASRSGQGYRYPGELPNMPFPGSWRSFSPVYSNGATELRAAAAVPIGTDGQTQVDFQMKMEPGYRIRGTLHNGGDEGVTLSFQLRRANGERTTHRASWSGRTGKFEMFDVTPGTYVLRVTRGEEARGEIPVSVGKSDVEGIDLTLHQAVSFDTKARSVEGPRLQTPFGPPCSLRFYDEGASLPAHDKVLPGAYRVRVVCTARYAVSAVTGAQDLLANPVWTIAPGTPPPPVEIAYRSDSGRLKVEMPPELAAARPKLVAVPRFSPSTGPEEIFTRGVGLAPGDYMIFAFAADDLIEYAKPEVLGKLTGTLVHIEKGTETRVEIGSLSR